jgi:hypothetical protein
LDLVPYRRTAATGKKPVSPYSVTIAAGYLTNSGNAGYDIISAPTLNASVSDASCTVPSAGPQTIGPSVTQGQGRCRVNQKLKILSSAARHCTR